MDTAAAEVSLGLLRDASGMVITLSGRVLVGRSAACSLRIADARVSSEHAVIAWRANGWWVRDLGSRNGTLVDGAPLLREVELRVGSTLSFGDAPACALLDAGPPVAQAESLVTGAITTANGDVLTLPPGETPLVSIVPDGDGAWTLVGDAETSTVDDRAVVVVDGQRWRLHLPTPADPTIASSAEIALVLEVSADEERVLIEISGGGRTVSLRPRTHNYLMLVLARARAADRRPDPAERGWVHRDELARMLRCDPATINVQLHRIRQDLGSHGLERAAALLEARPRSGQVRLGTERIEVRREGG